MTAYTSIQILPSTREHLACLKGDTRETYDGIIKKLIGLVPEGDDEGKYTTDFRIGLLNAKIELKEGKKVALSEAKKALGL